MSKEVEIIDGAIELLRKGWRRGYFAGNVYGEDTHELSEDAVCWCVWGAILRSSKLICDDEYSFERYKIAHVMNGVLRDMGHDPNIIHPALYNDDIAQSVDDVIGFLEKTKEKILNS